jgi:hypothetical protein
MLWGVTSYGSPCVEPYKKAMVTSYSSPGEKPCHNVMVTSYGSPGEEPCQNAMGPAVVALVCRPVRMLC